jgi:hypothetical protein
MSRRASRELMAVMILTIAMETSLILSELEQTGSAAIRRLKLVALVAESLNVLLVPLLRGIVVELLDSRRHGHSNKSSRSPAVRFPYSGHRDIKFAVMELLSAAV